MNNKILGTTVSWFHYLIFYICSLLPANPSLLPDMTFQSAFCSAVEDPQKTNKMFWMEHNQRLVEFPVGKKQV